MLQQGVIIRKLISQHHETAHDLWNGHLGAGCLRTIFYHKRKILSSSDLGESGKSCLIAEIEVQFWTPKWIL